MTCDASPRSAKLTRRAVGVLLLGVIVGTWWAYLRPTFVADGPVQLVVISGESMEPGMYTGDLAVLYRRDAYRAGDVVAYRSGRIEGGSRPGTGPFIIHRIRAGNGSDGFVMRGDNNPDDDPWQPTRTDVSGEMLFSVPHVGLAVNWLSQPVHAGALLAAVFVTLVLASEPRRRPEGSERDAPTENASTYNELVR